MNELDRKKFSIKQIAAQAGVSKATVDRVLHRRGQVHYQTLKRVEQAIRELDSQQRAALAAGRTLYFDVVMLAPERFSEAVAEAITSQVGSLAPYRISPRFHLFEDIGVTELVKLLQRSLEQGSQGVILKAPDEPPVNEAVNRLFEAGIPVATLVTDLPASRRIGYIGMDNRSAGRTAGYLMRRWLPPIPARVAVVLSSQGFRGEEERESGFRQWLREQAPHLEVVELSGGLGIYDNTLRLMTDCLDRHPDLNAVYSVGGGNRAIVDAFAVRGRSLEVLIGHDLDRENRQLLAEGRIAALIDHDLQQDARRAFMQLLRFHGFLPASAAPPDFSRVLVVTPFNMAG
ncbi:LacI family transcriptional regulator [Zobellella taiwanensis]|jgi:LacI family transcriptional regulator|uniref:LacI family transcriptional regulator n=1 Tax=Zobellella taiwanensis TaxID=347535 RepID=A0A2P7R9E5_9GAMM|nr:LacI family DNA-binding transcriptional regulator [Zobellella taiwanensis]PSJ46831.1 LacI family transcriptional regulator [Zobellella taiwanensis]